MKKKYFAAGLAASIIGLASVAAAQNLVDPATNDTDLSGYSNYLSRELADGYYTTDVVRTVVYREPVLATTTLDFQSQYGLPSINTRQLDYQHRRSSWRLAKGLPQPEPAPCFTSLPCPDLIPPRARRLTSSATGTSPHGPSWCHPISR